MSVGYLFKKEVRDNVRPIDISGNKVCCVSPLAAAMETAMCIARASVMALGEVSGSPIPPHPASNYCRLGEGRQGSTAAPAPAHHRTASVAAV